MLAFAEAARNILGLLLPFKVPCSALPSTSLTYTALLQDSCMLSAKREITSSLLQVLCNQGGVEEGMAAAGDLVSGASSSFYIVMNSLSQGGFGGCFSQCISFSHKNPQRICAHTGICSLFFVNVVNCLFCPLFLLSPPWEAKQRYSCRFTTLRWSVYCNQVN